MALLQIKPWAQNVVLSPAGDNVVTVTDLRLDIIFSS